MLRLQGMPEEALNPQISQRQDRIAISGKAAREGIQTSSNWLINYGFVRAISPL